LQGRSADGELEGVQSVVKPVVSRKEALDDSWLASD